MADTQVRCQPPRRTATCIGILACRRKSSAQPGMMSKALALPPTPQSGVAALEPRLSRGNRSQDKYGLPAPRLMARFTFPRTSGCKPWRTRFYTPLPGTFTSLSNFRIRSNVLLHPVTKLRQQKQRRIRTKRKPSDSSHPHQLSALLRIWQSTDESVWEDCFPQNEVGLLVPLKAFCVSKQAQKKSR